MKSFRSVAKERDGCTIVATFGAKKSIPGKMLTWRGFPGTIEQSFGPYVGPFTSAPYLGPYFGPIPDGFVCDGERMSRREFSTLLPGRFLASLLAISLVSPSGPRSGRQG